LASARGRRPRRAPPAEVAAALAAPCRVAVGGQAAAGAACDSGRPRITAAAAATIAATADASLRRPRPSHLPVDQPGGTRKQQSRDVPEENVHAGFGVPNKAAEGGMGLCGAGGALAFEHLRSLQLRAARQLLIELQP
jgi:hypothetical protein